jgi:hypothetical protein
MSHDPECECQACQTNHPSTVRPPVRPRERQPDGLAEVLPFPLVVPPTAQQAGTDFERQQAQRRGGRLTPMSGAGRIKGDIATDEHTIETKFTRRHSHTLKQSTLMTTLQAAERNGQEARYVVYFESADITLEGVISRGRP